MSFIARKATKAKKATPRAFRFSTNPYSGVAQSSSSDGPSATKGYFSTSKSFLKPASVSVGPWDMRKREERHRQDYEEEIKGYSLEQRRDLQALQQEIGWGQSDSPHEQDWATPQVLNIGPDLSIVNDDDNDNDWESDDNDRDPHAIPRILGMPIYTRGWRQRLGNEQLSWEHQLPSLCDTYLAFCINGPPKLSPAPEEADPPRSIASFEIECIFLTEQRKCSFSPLSPLELTTVTLMRHGFFCPTPTLPHVAIHVDVLRLLVALRRHAPALSVQAIGAVLSDVYNEPYVSQFRTHISNSIDVYLAINRMVDSRISCVLKRDDPDWSLRNSCAACTYKLNDEPDMKYSMIVTMDGNDSLKCVANSASVDRRVFNNNLILNTEYVNRFENEVASRNRSSKESPPGAHEPSSNESCDPSSNSQAQDGLDARAESDEVESESTPCEERWKNAKADKNARPIVKFDETGIFAVCCRHNTLLFFMDMRNSGELAKYGIAAVDKLITVFGEGLLIGYDIGWLILKQKYSAALDVTQTTPKFLTQLDPKGNEEKWLTYTHNERQHYQNLKNPPPLVVFPILYVRRLRILAEKQKAFDDAHAVKYAHAVPELIDQYRNHPTIQNTEKENKYPEIDAKVTCELEAKCASALEQLLTIQTEVAHMEKEHNIYPRWVAGSPEWANAVEMEKLLDFHDALDTLERATVQRLMELERANVSGTGYKLRVFIGKAIARREKALRTALCTYNLAAQKVEPPRPNLTFKQLIEYAYISNFDFLRQSRHGILAAEWGKPTNFKCGREVQVLVRAREEITRLNIEIRRVLTHIRDKESFLQENLLSLEHNNNPLSYHLRQHYELTLKINTIIIRDIHSIAKLPGFSGSFDCGVRFGSTAIPAPAENTISADSAGASAAPYRGATPHPEDRSVAIEANTPTGDMAPEDETVMELSDDQMAQLTGLEQSCSGCELQ